MSCGSLLPLLKGVWAEGKVGDAHLRLFAERNALGVRASVYNVIAKTWIAPSEPVDEEKDPCFFASASVAATHAL
jgi:hypothetical protein